ncbi:dual specificity protein phosphatase 13-like [Acipenser oxyrinchus oxyrinchus]|uniref:Dual specificity protein phosphatase n=1 Tax=Acipenser oxyrinchus oxyrinchus TaxID=40147 RepID=A0AAD8D873_ACIOX|nr:dual specificity protein phosphatase 13-like [Acipenser oxyrinchus oxyrinchus]
MAGHEDKQASKDKYETPSISELQRLLMVNRKSTGHVNEVWPNIYIGDAYTARDKGTLLNLGITHIVNAAHGIHHINTGAKYYSDTQMHYLGVEADDDPEFDLSPFFYPTAKFIRAGLNSPKGKVFVNCAMGVSRSATLVLAYLMICKNVTLVEAIKAVCEHRDVFPNSGFLSQLRQLDLALTLERRKKKKPQ